jgi:hypothetical protein
MPEDVEFVTVFRSAETDAESEAIRVRDKFLENGITAMLAGDETPGVVVGTFEVRVPAFDKDRAERIVSAGIPEEDELKVNEESTSHDLDLVPIFSSQQHDAESEALAIRSVLEANGIPCFLVGSPQIPSLPFEIRVPKSRAQEAKRILEEARQSGASEEAASGEPA